MGGRDGEVGKDRGEYLPTGIYLGVQITDCLRK